VGLWAPSQGAWVASRLAAQGGAPAFLIAVSGGGAAPQETERFAYRNALRAASASAEDIQSADSLLDRYFTYLRSGAGRDELLKEIERARAFAWYGQLNLHRVLPSEKTRDRWEWVSTYDPLPDVRMMKGFPVLLLFGEDDALQPTKVAVERWKTGLASAGNRDVEVRVFAGAGHFLRQEGPNPHQPGPYVDGLLETVDRWLGKVIGRGASGR
jgi:pimeloyl-ACP methyl ester carboxylesterase